MSLKTYLRKKGIFTHKTEKLDLFLKRNSSVPKPINSTAPDVELVDLNPKLESISDHIEV